MKYVKNFSIENYYLKLFTTVNGDIDELNSSLMFIVIPN